MSETYFQRYGAVSSYSSSVDIGKPIIMCITVSYTHLDVYKRQVSSCLMPFCKLNTVELYEFSTYLVLFFNTFMAYIIIDRCV